MTKRNTCLTPTSFAGLAERSKRFPSSTARTLKPRADGRGIATALSAVARPAEIMGPRPRMPETLDCESGARTILRRPRVSMPSATSRKNTDLARKRSRLCGLPNIGDAQSVTVRPAAYSWITATQRGTSERCFARPATRSLAGMNGKPAPSSSSNSMWRSTAVRPGQPCHADVLLEIANAEAGQ